VTRNTTNSSSISVHFNALMQRTTPKKISPAAAFRQRTPFLCPVNSRISAFHCWQL